jgi:multicomponent Na+:H+ antiporter subunit G
VHHGGDRAAALRDVPTRLHAATKPQVLGLILICLAIALSLRSWPVVAFLVPVVMMQLATAPLSAHMVGRQAYRNGTIDERSLYVDELDEARRTPCRGRLSARTPPHRRMCGRCRRAVDNGAHVRHRRHTGRVGDRTVNWGSQVRPRHSSSVRGRVP